MPTQFRTAIDPGDIFECFFRNEDTGERTEAALVRVLEITESPPSIRYEVLEPRTQELVIERKRRDLFEQWAKYVIPQQTDPNWFAEGSIYREKGNPVGSMFWFERRVGDKFVIRFKDSEKQVVNSWDLCRRSYDKLDWA